MISRVRGALWEYPHWWVHAMAAVAWILMLAHVRTSIGMWVLMVVAMMWPLQGELVRNVAFASLRRRRHRAMATFLAGYLFVWLLAALPMRLIEALFDSPYAAPAAFALAALYSLSRTHTFALKACHATRPLAPVGFAATRDAFSYGALIGGTCVLACFPLMVACTLAHHSILALVGGALVGVLERRAFRPRTRLAAAVIAALALLQLLRELHDA